MTKLEVVFLLLGWSVGLLFVLALSWAAGSPTPTPPVPESFDEFFARLDREFAERKQ
jgi:hypothetical protein